MEVAAFKRKLNNRICSHRQLVEKKSEAQKYENLFK